MNPNTGPQFPLSQLPSQNPQRSVTSDHTPFFLLLIAPARTIWVVPFWPSRRGFGSRRLCGRRRKPRLEPDVRSGRFVIVREIPNAAPFRVATFTRATPSFQKMPNATPIGLFPTGTINKKNRVRVPSRLLQPANQLLCCAHDRCAPPNHPHVAACQLLWVVATVRFLVFSLACPFTEATIVLHTPLIYRLGFYPSSGISSSREQFPRFLSRPGPLDSAFFSTGCLMDSSELRITYSLRGCRCATSFIQSFPSPAHLAIGVSHCIPLLRNPTLCFHRVMLVWPRHAPGGPASPPRSRSPHQTETKSPHYRNVTLVNSRSHSCPDFTRNFLGQQRQSHLPPTLP